MKYKDQFDEFGKKIADFAVRGGNLQDREFYLLTFANWFANAVCGAKQSSVDSMVAYYREQAPGTGLPVIGRKDTLSPSASVVVDAFSSVSLAYDDIHYETTLHPSAPVAAAIMGAARNNRISGEEALQAFQIGLEVECRLAKAMFGEGVDTSSGWYVSGIVGGVGAAAAIGRLLGLTEDKMEAAIGLAASRAAGVRGSHGAMSTYLVEGFAAEAGYTAAYMAAAGISGKLDALTGKEGLMRMVVPGADPAKALEGLGESFICEQTACKPYPYGFIAHAVIACCRQLSDIIKTKGCMPEKIEICIPSVSAKLGAMWVPENAFDAHTAIPYIAALVINDASMAFTPIDEDFHVSDEVLQMEKRICIVEDKKLCNSQSRCQAVFQAGSCEEVFCDVTPGAPGSIMGKKEILDKCRHLLTLAKDSRGAEEVLQELMMLDNMQNIADLL